MIFVFEDNPDDILSKFFREAYDTNISREFVYAEGNGNLKKVASQLLADTDKTIVVYMDYFPDNKDTVKIFRDLKEISKNNNYRLITLPIVCVEHCLLKHLKKEGLVIDLESVDIALAYKPYDNSKAISTDEDKKFCKTFEKYCKLLLKKGVEDCAKISGEKVYYKFDCVCNIGTEKCENRTLESKALAYVSMFPCFPVDKKMLDVKNFSLEEIWEIHRELVDGFNSLSIELEKIKPDTKYRRIAKYK